MDLINGVPAHPLFVHLPVVVIPLVMIGCIVSLVMRGRSKGLLIGLAVLAFAATAGAYLAEQSGEKLEKRVEESALLEAHTNAAENVLPLAGLLFLELAALAAVAVISGRGDAGDDEGGPLRVVTKNAPRIITVGTAVAVLTAGAAGVVTYQVGHSGAKAAWDDVAKTTPRAGHDGGDDGG